MHQHSQDYIELIRSFNRFYTDLIGVLTQHLYNSQYSLAEARIIYEIYHAKTMTASQIMYSIHIDKSYLSRILKNLERKGLIQKFQSNADGRALHLSLTTTGVAEFERLTEESRNQINRLTSSLTQTQKDELTEGMKSIMKILKTRSNDDH